MRHALQVRLTSALLVAMLTAAPAAGAQALKTDRDSYAIGDAIRLTASIPPSVMPRRPILTITLSWESDRRQRVLGINTTLVLHGHAVAFPAPVEPGDWQIRLYDRAKPSPEPIAAVSFKVAAAASPERILSAGVAASPALPSLMEAGSSARSPQPPRAVQRGSRGRSKSD